MTDNTCFICGKKTVSTDLSYVHLLPHGHCWTYGVEYLDNDDYIPTDKDFTDCDVEFMTNNTLSLRWRAMANEIE